MMWQVMIPLLWRYLSRSYFQTFFLSLCAFVGILIVMRLQEIARFATSGAGPLKVVLFALFQVPYILPMAIPISCLIATLILFHRLSFSHELTALRSSGFSLKNIRAPLIYIATLLSLANFTIASELSPRCKALSKELIFDLVKTNPLFPLQRDSLVKLKKAYYHIGNLKDNTSAQDVLLVTKSRSNNVMTLLFAKDLHIEGEWVKGNQLAFISSMDAKKEGFGHLIIENQHEMQIQAQSLSQFLQKVDNSMHSDYLSLHELVAYGIAKKGSPLLCRDVLFEITRRISLGLSPLTLTLLGIAFGIHIGRSSSRTGLLKAALLTALLLSCFIAAKSFEKMQIVALTIFLVPHPLLASLSLLKLKKVDQGVE